MFHQPTLIKPESPGLRFSVNVLRHFESTGKPLPSRRTRPLMEIAEA